jgi:glucose-fructose oxidoreductase
VRIVGINFDHFHMGDLLRMVVDHPTAELAGICDGQPERMVEAIRAFSLRPDQVFTDVEVCLERTAPDVAILCPAPAHHASLVEQIAPFGVHILMEKPMAASLVDADRMIRAMESAGRTLAINWPLVWSPTHRTAKRLCDEGVIGEVREVHYYGGNRGPLYHVADKREVSEEEVRRRKPESWFYRRAEGGGSLLDYLGYGVTLGSWFHGGRAPLEIMTMVDRPEGLEVDEHSITVARYATGLSKFETRWGTFTDPWTHQPQPKCGFVIVGGEGTITSYDYAPAVSLQTRERPEAHPVTIDPVEAPHRNAVEHLLHCLSTGEPLVGPLTPAMSRLGQQMVETAAASAAAGRALPLIC